ncbi:GFA family protein [Zhongshania sp. BJYM1]|uniref:GFA family protein n=1 Tax=Zhongshania aquatica TaxID=2965069 RepID=UPI0022B5CDB7|nr:GFA family protein [Marortus sp. BJYM1]
MKKNASCVCGQLSVSVNHDPELVIMCHCEICQRRSGSAFQLAAFYYETNVAGVFGESKNYTREADSGRSMSLFFCPICGVSVYFRSAARPNLVGVHVGCFADKHFPAPNRAVWLKQKHDWVVLPDVDSQFDENSI